MPGSVIGKNRASMKLTLPARRLRRAAAKHFGWRALRPGQLAAMRALYRRRDALVVLPTGAGKSAVYQVPATQLPGPTIVVSPLLALQEDQINGLNERNDPVLRAVRVSSAETPNQQAEALDEVRRGRSRFLFITPEQLADPDRLAQVRELRPALVAVDEAHCISSWGYDFRPDYLALGHLIADLGRPPIVALTATASPPVREDIIGRLRLRDPYVAVAGLDRPNLFVEAAHCPDEEYRWRRLVALLREDERPGIIYLPTRRAVEELADRLTAAGFPAASYHGGMAKGLRTQRHEDFLDDRIPIMVATSAFGMGIDKPNIRWVAHLALPDSPDSYLQEIGRAGRDGAPARGVLLHRAEDMALQRFFNGGLPDLDELRDLAAVLRDGGPHSRAELRRRTELSERKLGRLVALLEEVDAAVVLPNNRIVAPHYGPLPAQAAQAALDEAERMQAVQRSRTDMMRGFAESTQCRTQLLLAYFGEHMQRACTHCDNCHEGNGEAAVVNGPFPLHSTVRHTEWGTGLVLRYEDDRMTVLFDDVGYKTLSVPVVEEQNLLALEGTP